MIRRFLFWAQMAHLDTINRERAEIRKKRVILRCDRARARKRPPIRHVDYDAVRAEMQEMHEQDMHLLARGIIPAIYT